MISRDRILDEIKGCFKVCRMVCLLGPKGSGKEAIAEQIAKEYSQVKYFDLEDISDLQALNFPDLSLQKLRGLIIIKGIQRRPEIFPYLRYLYDQKLDQTFIILGDFFRRYIRQNRESLAGRMGYIEVTPFSLSEVKDLERLWLRGGFPESYLPEDVEESMCWRKEYMISHAERRLTTSGFKYDVVVMRRLWEMLADEYGQIADYSAFARKLEVTHPTVKTYIMYLEVSFMLRILRPWYEDIPKRQVCSPKVYYRDSGLVNCVLKIRNWKDLFRNFRYHVLFEGFAIEEIIKFHRIDPYDCYYWKTYNGAELDLLLTPWGRKLGFEFTTKEKPKLTTSMRIAMKDLKLDSLTVICLKGESYMLADKIKVISLEEYLNTEVPVN